ncbi:hypothetical protein ACFQ07_16925, partial [Actinomadura adrarensis]
SGAKGSSGTRAQEEFADRARDTYVPPPPSTPGIDQKTLDAIRDAAEAGIEPVQGVNGTYPPSSPPQD